MEKAHLPAKPSENVPPGLMWLPFLSFSHFLFHPNLFLFQTLCVGWGWRAALPWGFHAMVGNEALALWFVFCALQILGLQMFQDCALFPPFLLPVELWVQYLLVFFRICGGDGGTGWVSGSGRRMCSDSFMNRPGVDPKMLRGFYSRTQLVCIYEYMSIWV